MFYPDQLVTGRLYHALHLVIPRYGRKTLIDVGCGGSPYQPLLPDSLTRYVRLDLEPGGNTSVTGSVASIPLATASVDAILCTQVWEHVFDQEAASGELGRVTSPGGCCVVSVPQYGARHEVPNGYFGYARFSLGRLTFKHGFDLAEHFRQGGAFAVAGLAVNSGLPARLLDTLCASSATHGLPRPAP
ncbi:MAG: class I SAM-dependent methyltransferase [Candidatus Tyrphobacter sp.]